MAGMNAIFGQRWDAPVADDAPIVETPIGRPCLGCGEPIAEGDRGLMTVYVSESEPSVEPFHAECQMLGIIGHVFGVCGCTGHDHSRASAMVLLDAVNARRATSGQPPL